MHLHLGASRYVGRRDVKHLGRVVTVVPEQAVVGLGTLDGLSAFPIEDLRSEGEGVEAFLSETQGQGLSVKFVVGSSHQVHDGGHRVGQSAVLRVGVESVVS